MGAGRRTETINMHHKLPWSSIIETSSTSARNLRRSDLGGVIFGCKHNTMAECLSKQLFGLPFSHISYVRNIGAGLPLFLFNYSDRKLHGIYEAASDGQLYIDAYAWTDAGAERTSFPAQVYIRIRTQCKPLVEDQFKKIIEDNYYTPHHFWFELDHAQTRGLISLFKPYPPLNKMLSPALPTFKWKPTVTREHLNGETSKPLNNLKPSNNMVNVTLLHCNGNIQRASSSRTSSSDHEDVESGVPVSDWEDLAEQTNSPCTFPLLDGANQTFQKPQSCIEDLVSEEKRILCLLEKLVAERERTKSSSKVCTVDRVDPCIPIDANETSEHLLDESTVLVAKKDISTGSDVHHRNLDDANASAALGIDQEKTELVQVMTELKERNANLERQQVEADQELQQLRSLVRDVENSIQLLEDHVEELETEVVSSNVLVDSTPDEVIEQCLFLEDTIYLIGGYDGHSTLSSVDSFAPSLDKLTPVKSMSYPRSYAASVALDCILFAIGGGDGCLWLDTVEYYNTRSDEWALCPSMLCEKGQLGAATLNGKIYAIGGGDGKESFSDVEIFDPVYGKWLDYKRMIHRRFAPTAADLNGVIYAVGGYDGYEYLRSTEKIDPREGYWIELPSMKTRRGCHSMAVFNEKLYCMGGFNAEEMVSSVEIFEPRMNSWAMGEPMKFVRGYAAAAVLGDSLFVIGGAVDNGKFVDTVECYKDGSGWTTNDCKAIGKRSALSAIVL